MLHSYVIIWIHLVWGTYKHERILNRELRPKLREYLISHSKEMGIVIDQLNIQPEHIHCLFQLPSDTTVSHIAKALKGRSSQWINENRFLMGKFNWQRGYGAFSISASQFPVVKRYIQNQDEHHHRKTFTEEYNDWLRNYGPKGVDEGG